MLPSSHQIFKFFKKILVCTDQNENKITNFWNFLNFRFTFGSKIVE